MCMKKLFFYPIVLFIILLVSCNSNENSKNKEVKTKIVKTETYSLNSEKSNVTWKRVVDYKHLTKRVKLFGSYVNTELDNVNLETNGILKVNKGNLVLIDDAPKAAEIEIALTLTRFYSDVEEMFFESESYSPASLVISKFEHDSISENKYIVTANLTINSKISEINFPCSLIKTETNMVFSGTYLMQVSDWPLLKQVKPENVNLDEISFGFDFVFDDVIVLNDTIII